jgi:hypothetical protein
MYKYTELKQIGEDIVILANKEEKHSHAFWGHGVYSHETFKPYNADERKKFETWWFNKGNCRGRLSEGIEITCCEIRVENCDRCVFDGSHRRACKLTCDHAKKFAFYKPEAKEESQEDLYSLLWIKSKRPLIEEDRFIEECKKDFTITRNTK